MRTSEGAVSKVAIPSTGKRGSSRHLVWLVRKGEELVDARSMGEVHGVRFKVTLRTETYCRTTAGQCCPRATLSGTFCKHERVMQCTSFQPCAVRKAHLQRPTVKRTESRMYRQNREAERADGRFPDQTPHTENVAFCPARYYE